MAEPHRRTNATVAAFDVDIRGKSVSVDRRDLQVLGGIRLEVAHREIVAIVGNSGAGKTTLLRAMAGLDVELDGTIRTFGRVIDGPGRDRGLVFQEHRLLPWMTVGRNVAYAVGGRAGAAGTVAVVERALDLVGLTGFANAWPKQLSGGMAQRASLARALATTPEILLLDEPLGALDSLLRMQMQAEVERVVLDQELTAVLVTHDVDEAVILADRVVVMSGPPGRVCAEVRVELDRPRRSTDSGVQALRAQILNILHEGAADGRVLVHPDPHGRPAPVDDAPCPSGEPALHHPDRSRC